MEKEKIDNRPMVKAIATARGWDGARIREVGESFLVPAAMFDKRERRTKDEDGKVVVGEYDPPSWFEAAVEEEVTETRTVSKKDADKKAGKDIG